MISRTSAFCLEIHVTRRQRFVKWNVWKTPRHLHQITSEVKPRGNHYNFLPFLRYTTSRLRVLVQSVVKWSESLQSVCQNITRIARLSLIRWSGLRIQGSLWLFRWAFVEIRKHLLKYVENIVRKPACLRADEMQHIILTTYNSGIHTPLKGVFSKRYSDIRLMPSCRT